MPQSSDLLEIGLRQGFTKRQVADALRSLDDFEVERLAWMCRWVDARHAFQVVPDGQWSQWVILAGRGSGKTRVGAEWSGMRSAMGDKGHRQLVVAPTKSDLRAVCFEGDSGLIRVIPPSLIKYYHKTPAPEIMLHNGALIGGIAAEAFERTRGPQWHGAWCDEVAAWGEGGKADPEEVWDTMVMSIRLGQDTRILVTTTPKNRPLVKRLVSDEDSVMTSASTHVNAENLSPEFARRILKYDGTKIGRQEVYAELIDAEEGGIISRSWLRHWPANKPLPEFHFIVMSLDTGLSEEDHDKKKQTTDPSACAVFGCFKYERILPSGVKVIKPGIMLLDCWAERLGYPDLLDKVKKESDPDKIRYGRTLSARPIILPGNIPKAYRMNGPAKSAGRAIDLIVIEGKANGKSLRQSLAKDGINTIQFNPTKDKLERGHFISPIIKDGILWVPDSPNPDKAGNAKFMSWAEPLVEQLCSYSGEGSVVHDDLYDAATQGLNVVDWYWLHHLQQQSTEKKKRAGVIHEDRPPDNRILTNPYAE